MSLLLVHDDEAARERLATTLRQAGLSDIHEAADADTAVLLANDLRDLDMLITRSVLPGGGGGGGLLSSLRYRFPELGAAFLGATEDVPLDVASFDDPTETQELAGIAAWASAGGTEGATRRSQLPKILGGYRLSRLLANSGDILTFEATQESVARPVALRLLKPERSNDPEAIRDFHRLVRSQAALVHQHVAPVYEANQEGQNHFYTGELVPGRNLLSFAEEGAIFGDDQVLNALRVTGEAMTHMSETGIHRRRLRASDIFIDENGATRLVNNAIADESGRTSQVRDIQTLVSNLQPLAEPGIASELVDRLADPNDASGRSWSSLLEATSVARKAVRRKRASDAALNLAEANAPNKGAKKAVLISIGALLLLSLIFLASLIRSKDSFPEAREFGNLIRIPDSSFPAGKEKIPVRVETFWIDQHEVCIDQYASFLEAIDAGTAGNVAHPDQPTEKVSYRPDNWETLYSTARKGGTFQGVRIDLNCPISGVDWWDAYSYAKWQNRRLPTSIEWEKAARGRSGNPYPWGSKPSNSKCNTGADYKPDGSGGKKDGFNLWAPVDAHPEDLSDYGVLGMAGNVEEWTATLINHPAYPDLLVPAVRGASFASDSPMPLHRTTAASTFEEATLTRGFRTATSKDPEQ